jgi:uncharacterized protein YrrD
MLRSLRDLEKYSIRATDDDIGSVKDFYFDDSTWVIRYLIVDTSAWLPNRKVLISPISMGRPDWGEKILPVKITKQQVKDSPDIDTDKPVSRQHEMNYLGYYGYPYYWGGGSLWGDGTYPYSMLEGTAEVAKGDSPHALSEKSEQELLTSDKNQHEDPHLRSCKEVMGYRIEAKDGDIGHIHDMLVDERTWAIRYIVVNTSNWFGGHQVLIVPEWIRNISWSKHMVDVDLTRKQVKDAPIYDPEAAFSRQEEESVYRHYGRNGYWNNTPKDQARPPSR